MAELPHIAYRTAYQDHLRQLIPEAASLTSNLSLAEALRIGQVRRTPMDNETPSGTGIGNETPSGTGMLVYFHLDDPR